MAFPTGFPGLDGWQPPSGGTMGLPRPRPHPYRPMQPGGGFGGYGGTMPLPRPRPHPYRGYPLGGSGSAGGGFGSLGEGGGGFGSLGETPVASGPQNLWSDWLARMGPYLARTPSESPRWPSPTPVSPAPLTDPLAMEEPEADPRQRFFDKLHRIRSRKIFRGL